MSRVEVTDLTFAYGTDPVLRQVSLQVEDGSLTAVVGPSGCGKTTLLRLLCGFERPASGAISIGGTVVAGPTWVPPHHRRVGVVPQEGALFPHLSLARNVALGLPRRGASRADRVAELLELGGLAALGERLPREVSGGQQQRAALLRALAPRPRLVLLDEPFGSLDADVRVRLRSSVRDLLVTEGATALLVTHDREEALSLADAVVVLLEGRVAQSGPPVEVYSRPASRAVARLLGEAAFLPARAAGDRTVDTVLGRLAAAGPVPTGAVEVLLRPEQLVAVAADAGAACRVVAAEYAGALTRARVALVGHPGVELPATLPPGAVADDVVHLAVPGPVHVLADARP